MSNITFTVDFTGSPDSGDAEAATYAVEAYNAQYGTTLETTPASTLKASYLTVLGALASEVHGDYQQKAASAKEDQNGAFERWRISTDAQRAAALAELEPLP